MLCAYETADTVTVMVEAAYLSAKRWVMNFARSARDRGSHDLPGQWRDKNAFRRFTLCLYTSLDDGANAACTSCSSNPAGSQGLGDMVLEWVCAPTTERLRGLPRSAIEISCQQ